MSADGSLPFVMLLLLPLAALAAPALIGRYGRDAMIGLAAAPAAVTGWLAAELPAVLNGGSRSVRLDWVPALSLTVDLRLDALSAVLGLVIAGVGSWC